MLEMANTAAIQISNVAIPTATTTETVGPSSSSMCVSRFVATFLLFFFPIIVNVAYVDNFSLIHSRTSIHYITILSGADF